MNYFTIKTTDLGQLKIFLNHFKKISDSLLIEVHKTGLIAKTYTPDKSLIKRSTLDFSEFCDDFEINDFPDNFIKFPFVKLEKLIKNIDIIDANEVELEFHWNKVRSENLGISLDFKIPKLHIKAMCDELQYTVSLSDEIFNRLVNNIESLGKLEITSSDLRYLSK